MKLKQINQALIARFDENKWSDVNVMTLGNGDCELFLLHNGQVKLVNIDHETGDVFETVQNVTDFPPAATENGMREAMRMSMLRMRKYST